MITFEIKLLVNILVCQAMAQYIKWYYTLPFICTKNKLFLLGPEELHVGRLVKLI